MDALAAVPLGFVGVGLMGNQPPDKVISHVIDRVRTFQLVIIIPDQDHVEMGAYLLGHLAAHGIKARVLLPQAKDFADMSIRERRRLLGVD